MEKIVRIAFSLSAFAFLIAIGCFIIGGTFALSGEGIYRQVSVLAYAILPISIVGAVVFGILGAGLKLIENTITK